MSNFTVTSNGYLRNLYAGNRDLINVSERAKVSTRDLGKADAKALSKGIAALSSYDYENSDDDSVDFYKMVKGFADSYNYTLESSNSLSEGDQRTKAVLKDIKKLREDYKDELAKYGISFKINGYMEVDGTAFDNIKPQSYKRIMGSDSDFMKDLSDISKKLTRRINYLV